MEARITYLKSKFGKKILQHNKYLYYFHAKLAGNRQAWCCIDKHKGCKARIYIINGEYQGFCNNHSHPQDEGRILRLSFVNELKRKVVENPELSVQQLYKTSLCAATKSEISAKFPSFENIRHSLQNERNKVINYFSQV